MSVTTISQKVEKNQIFSEIKKCLGEESGFYMMINERSVLVDNIKKTPPIKEYSNYGLAVLSHSNSESASTSFSPDVAITEGQPVYYAAFDEEESVIMCHKGHISSISEVSQGVKQFTIDGSRVSKYPTSPVFTYDKVNKALSLAGVILSSNSKSDENIGRAVHVNLFNSIKKEENLGEERGGVNVKSGEFKGVSVGTGKGPRKLLINGPGAAEVMYDVRFCGVNGKELEPHKYDGNYNKNPEKMFQDALDAFVANFTNNNLPVSFTFEFMKSPYIAKKL